MESSSFSLWRPGERVSTGRVAYQDPLCLNKTLIAILGSPGKEENVHWLHLSSSGNNRYCEFTRVSRVLLSWRDTVCSHPSRSQALTTFPLPFPQGSLSLMRSAVCLCFICVSMNKNTSAELVTREASPFAGSLLLKSSVGREAGSLLNAHPWVGDL